MSDIIQNTINKVLGDGARASKFKCFIQLPSLFSLTEGKDLDTLVKTTAFPTRTNEIITIQHKGRDIPLPGQEKFTQELEITFYMQEDHRNKIIFEQWAEALNYDMYSETSDPFVIKLKSNQNNLKTSITLTQLNFENTYDTASYTFFNVFPKIIQGSSASSDAIDTVGEFTVTFSFTHYKMKQTDGVILIQETPFQPFDSGVQQKNVNKSKIRNLIITASPFKENKNTWIGAVKK